MILCADDVVMFHAGRTNTDIENSLSSELEQITSWFNENNLVINLMKSKTECVLYGTDQKMSGVSGFEVRLHGMKITVSTFYNCLGVIMDKSLSYKEHIETVLKKANSRVKLLSHIKQDLTPHAAETVYKVIILPLLLYCNNVFIDMSSNRKHQFEEIQMRCVKIINGKRDSVKLTSINFIRIKCVQLKFSNV